MHKKRLSIKDIVSHKGKQPIVCLTSYTAPITRILDKYADILLVGDSVGMVIYGMESTLAVTLDIMINHGKAVVSASDKALIVVDLPFGSYQRTPAQAFANASVVMSQTGCQAIKLEGGVEMAETINFLVERGIPVMGHVGLMPQHINSYGGYEHHGKTKESQKKIMEDALAVQKAGAFSLVIEGVKETLAHDVTKKLAIPVIGIGGSPMCDGQILVSDDMLGFFDEFKPKFVKRYANLLREVDIATSSYAKDVRARKFPEAEHCF